jgi:drug/metabolite transporter (DMT)-like permease
MSTSRRRQFEGTASHLDEFGMKQQENQAAARSAAAEWCLLGTAIIWGINIPVVKAGTEQWTPLLFNAARMVVSLVTLFGLVLWRWQVDGPWSTNLPWRRIAVFSLLSGLAYPLAITLSIDHTTSTNTAMIMASMPVWAAMLAWWLAGEHLSRLGWLGLLVTFTGAMLVVQSGGPIAWDRRYLLGNLGILLAAVLWALATVVSRPLFASVAPVRLTWMSSLATTPIHVVLGLLAWRWGWAESTAGQPWMDWRSLWPVFFTGMLATGIAYATWNYGVQKLGSAHASAYQNVVTLVAVAVSWWWLREAWQLQPLIGGMLVLLGLWLMRRSRQPTPRS